MSAGSRIRELLKAKPWIPLSGGILLLILGLVLSDIPMMITSQGWPFTQGRIISRTLLGQKFEEYDGDYYFNIDGYIHYQYQVDGTTYTSRAVNALNTPNYPYEIAVRYPEGKPVDVYYNPRNPSQAVLEPGWVLTPRAFGLVSSLFVYCGLFFIVTNILNLRKRIRKT